MPCSSTVLALAKIFLSCAKFSCAVYLACQYLQYTTFVWQ